MVSAAGTSCIPKYCCLAPIRWVCDKIIAVVSAIFGYLIRIVTFQLGEMHKTGANLIMRIYQHLSSDPHAGPIDYKRLEESEQFLEFFGGLSAYPTPADAKNQVHCMIFKSEDFFARFKDLGYVPTEHMYEGRLRHFFLNPPPEARKFKFPIVDLTLDDGTVVKAALLPERPAVKKPPMILFCHSPGRSFAMDLKNIGQHLAAGYDITVFDYRGTIKSKGIPSEPGYYLDAEAVYKHVRKDYPADRIYVSGFCGGAAVATHLKKRFHHEGVHLIASHPYTSMKEMIDGYGCIARFATRFGMDAIKDPTLKVHQDGFNNLEKLSNLRYHPTAKSIFLETDTDNMVPPNSVAKLAAAAQKAGIVHTIRRQHPNKKENGHMQPPDQDPVVWRQYIQCVT